MCLDLTFISVLLEDGFGLKTNTPLKVSLHNKKTTIYVPKIRMRLNLKLSFSFQIYKKIGGHEISWALGCAYNILTNNMGSNL